MRQPIAIAGLFLVLIGAGCGGGQEPSITVVTWNVYMGASPDPVIAAQSLEESVDAATRVYARLVESDFPARARAIAREITEARPELIALQEVSLVRVGPPKDPAPSTEIALDYLSILLAALQERGTRYRVAGVSLNFDGEVTAFTPDGPADVRLTDRDVVLALDSPGVAIGDVSTGNYEASLVLTSLAGPVSATRGWVAVEVGIEGRTFRFVNTHLQPAFAPDVQMKQARELLSGPAAGSGPTILAGDFNSAADGTETGTYAVITDAGYTDAWVPAGSERPGATCCQAAGLRNTESELTRRIDLVLARNGFTVVDARVVGAAPASKTGAGLWPSDHAGVVVTLKLN